MPEIIVIAHNIRSSYNIGSIFRTCEGLGIKELILSGYSPYPRQPNDKRLPHIASRVDNRIKKTSLNTEKYQSWTQEDDIFKLIDNLRASGYTIASLEQSPKSINLDKFTPPDKIAVILGSEVEGIDKEILEQSDVILEIAMKGKKESFNVSVATAMCLYSLTSSK